MLSVVYSAVVTMMAIYTTAKEGGTSYIVHGAHRDNFAYSILAVITVITSCVPHSVHIATARPLMRHYLSPNQTCSTASMGR
jgi:hypothetical protein